jgi:LemA protein
MIINICLAIVIVLVGIILVCYNKLVTERNHVKQAASGIDIVLNQRFDLIPNLVECVKGYSKYESETLEDLVEARSSYQRTEGVDIKEAEKINNKFNRILAVAESYPDLKSNEQYLILQNKLSNIESQLQAARSTYNAYVTKYNTSIETIPSNIVAKMFAFEKSELFKIEDDKKENITVNVQ